MKKFTFRKQLAILLTIIMVFALLPVSALAAENVQVTVQLKGTAVSGASVTLNRSTPNSYNQTKTTIANGSANFSGLRDDRDYNYTVTYTDSNGDVYRATGTWDSGGGSNGSFTVNLTDANRLPATVTMLVTVNGTNTNGVSISLTGPGGTFNGTTSGTGGNIGSVVLNNVPYGTYTYTANYTTGGYIYTKTGTLDVNSPSISSTIALTSADATAVSTVTTTVTFNDGTIGGVSVSLTGDEVSFSGTTSGSGGNKGKVSFSNVPYGTYTYTARYTSGSYYYFKTGTLVIDSATESITVNFTNSDRVTANLDHIDVYHQGYLTVITYINGVPQGSGTTENVAISNVSATLVDPTIGVNADYSDFTNQSQNGEQEYHKSTVRFSNNAVITINATMTVDGVNYPFSQVISGASLAAAIDECPANSGADIRLTDQEIINTFTHNVTFIALDGGTLQAGATTNDQIQYTNLAVGATFPSRPTPVADGGKEFVGWYADQACTTPASFPATVTGATTWYAKFQTAHVPVYQYKIIEHYTLIVNGVAQPVETASGSTQTAPGAGNATCPAGTTTTYEGVTYTYNAAASNVLSTPLIDGTVVELHRYWTRTAQYSYKIIDHFTLTINGVPQTPETEDSGVIASATGGNATCTTPGTKTHNSLTYTYNAAAANVTSTALVDGQTVVLHRYWTRAAQYSYKIIDHFTLTVNGVAQTPETEDSGVISSATGGNATTTGGGTKTHNGVTYTYDTAAANVLSTAFIDGTTVVLHRYWKRTAEYKYQITDHFILTVNGVAQPAETVNGTIQTTGVPGNATTTGDGTTTYEGVTYTYDSANAGNLLSTPLIDGQTVVLHRYWKRTAQFAYKIVDHFTLTVNGVAQPTELFEGSVQTSSAPGNASCTADPTTSYEGVTYAYDTANAGNVLSTPLIDGTTVVLHRYWKRTAQFAYKIVDHFTLTINGVPQAPATVESAVTTTGVPGNAITTAPSTNTYNSLTYAYDSANAGNVLSTPLVDGQTVVLHRYWKRTAQYSYKIVDHFTLTINGAAQPTETIESAVTTTGIPGSATTTAAASMTYEGVTYTYDSANAANVLSTPLIDGTTVVLHRYWKRTAQFAYKIADHFTLTINGVAQTPETVNGEVQTTGVPGNATTAAPSTMGHNSVTYNYNTAATNVLSIPLVDGQTVELHRYWVRTAQYAYKIIDHYTLTINGVAQTPELVDSGAINAPAGGTASCTHAPTTTYESVTYNYDSAAANVSSTPLIDGQTVVLHRYWKRTAEFKYKLIDHYTLTINGAAQTPETVESAVTTTGVPGNATTTAAANTTYEGVTYLYDNTAANVLSIPLVDGQTVVLHRFWVRTAQYAYKVVDHYMLTINNIAQTPETTESTVTTTGVPGNATTTGGGTTTYESVTYTYDGTAANVLSTALIDGQTVVLHRYWVRTAAYAYKIIDHFTLMINGVAQIPETVDSGVMNSAADGNATCTADPTKTYESVSYIYDTSAANVLSTPLIDGQTVVLHRYWIRTAEYAYKIIDHFTLTIGGMAQAPETIDNGVVNTAADGNATCTADPTKAYEGVTYTYDSAAANVLSTPLIDSQTVVLHRYYVRTAVYKYQMNLHYTVNTNGTQVTTDVNGSEVELTTPETITLNPNDYLIYNGFTYDYSRAGTTGTSAALVDGQTIVFDLYFARTAVFKYQINRHYNTNTNGIGATVDETGAVVTTGDPANIVIDPNTYINYNGKTFTFDAQRSDGLTITLIDGETVLVDLYYTRDAQFSYTIIRHYTTYTDGVFNGFTSVSDGVVSTGNFNASQSANGALYTTYNGVTYDFTGATGNPTGTLADGVTAQIHFYYEYNDIPLNPPEEPDDDDDDIPLDPTAGDPNDLFVFISIAGAAIAAIVVLAVIDKKSKHNV